jgi:hypothetical protein
VTPLRDGLKRRKTISSTSLIVLRMCKIHTKIDCICLQHTPHADAHHRTRPWQPANRRTLSPVRESRVCSPSPSSAQELPLCRSPPPPMSSPQRPLLQIDSAPTPLTFLSSFFAGSRAGAPLFLPPDASPSGREEAPCGRRRHRCFGREEALHGRHSRLAQGRLRSRSTRRSHAPPLEVDPQEPPPLPGPHAATAAAPDLGPLNTEARSLPTILLEADGRRQGAAARHDPTAGSAPVCALTAGSRV